jgi:branched-chain amino acid transport system substrate-binding protein
VLNERVRDVVTAHGGEILGEEYFPLGHADYRETVERIISEGMYGCLDYYRSVTDPFSQKLLAQYDGLYPQPARFAGRCSG